MDKKSIIVLAIIFIFGIGGYFTLVSLPEITDTQIDEDGNVTPIEVAEVVTPPTYTHSGTLADVRGGISAGISQARFIDGSYELIAGFTNLEDPAGTDFYEGWVVRRGDNMSVISTGRVEKIDGNYQDTFTSEEYLLDHDFYVLTLEPDDGDPAPAAHIVEGVMQLVK